MKDSFKLEAEGNFSFNFYIEKAQAVDEPAGKFILRGIASTLNLDHDNERMAKDALTSMCTIINEKSVPLRYEHSKEDSAIIGNVSKAWIDERNQLWIDAELDPNHPAGESLYTSIKNQGLKMGFSVGGKVKKAVKEFAASTGRMVKTFYDVLLDEVSVTKRPANYDAWLFAKSIASKDEDTSPYYNTSFYKEFLFENKQLDYMQSFAKSIPDKAWKKINNNLEKNMDETKKEETTTETKEKSQETSTEETKEKAMEGVKDETTTETKEKSADGEKTETTEETKEKSAEEAKTEETTKGIERAEFDALKSMVTEGFTALKKFMEGNKEDTTTETKEKSQEETATETKEKAQETTGEETKKEDNGKDSETETENEYAIKLKSIVEKLEKATEGTKDETKEETTTKSAMDTVVESLAKSVDSIIAKYSENGKSIPGFEKHISDAIKTNPEIQAILKEAKAEPGFKKSISVGGTAYMRTKDGKMIAIGGKEAGADEEVKKSITGKSFKEAFKTNFSSFK